MAVTRGSTRKAGEGVKTKQVQHKRSFKAPLLKKQVTIPNNGGRKRMAVRVKDLNFFYDGKAKGSSSNTGCKGNSETNSELMRLNSKLQDEGTQLQVNGVTPAPRGSEELLLSQNKLDSPAVALHAAGVLGSMSREKTNMAPSNIEYNPVKASNSFHETSYHHQSTAENMLDPSTLVFDRQAATIGNLQCFAATNGDETTLQRGEDGTSNDIMNGPEERSSNCILRNSHVSPSMSLNLTEMAEQMNADDSDEVDSHRSVVKGYRVKPEYEDLLNGVLAMHGDIAANCLLGTVTFRSFCMEVLCGMLQKLMTKTIFTAVTDAELDEMLACVDDYQKAGIEVGWFKERLDEISEAKLSLDVLKKSSHVKQLQANLKARIEKMENQLDDRKSDFAVKQSEIHDLQKKVYAAQAEIHDLQKNMYADQSDISAAKIELAKIEKVISQNKNKVRQVYELGSLVQGLMP